MLDPELRDAIRAEVRSYVAMAASRYVPVLAGALALVLLVVVVPDASSTSSAGLAAGNSGGIGTTPGTTSASSSSSLQTRAGSASPANGSTPSGLTQQSGGAVSGTSSTISGGATSSGNPGSGGGFSTVAVNGVKCGPGVRQVPWSPYAPMCVGRWTGNNGGATANGVTSSTVTLVMRNPTDWNSISSAQGGPSFAQLAHDEEVLVRYFNTQYELYGRQVVVKTFNGQGSVAAEMANQGQAQASADAQTAHGLGAFADGFHIATGTYADAEDARGIIQFSPANSSSAYASNAPYRYGLPAGPVDQIEGAGLGALVCQRMASMNAVFAGDPTYRTRHRSFAVLEAEQPDFAGGAAVLIQEAKQCGTSVKLIQYSADTSTEAQQAAQITTELKANRITTVILLSDPFMNEFMTDSAAAQFYQPEWVFTIFPQALARQANASEIAHSIDISPWHATSGAPTQRLCYRIYKQADPTGTPQSGAQSLDYLCALLMSFFAAVQQAGPTLTPLTFERGWFSLPNSAGSSDFGRWSFARGYWSPDATFSVLQWNASVHSPYDNGTGEWAQCGGPLDYPDVNPKLGSGQVQCYGQ
jgi:hypothetical protein